MNKIKRKMSVVLAFRLLLMINILGRFEGHGFPEVSYRFARALLDPGPAFSLFHPSLFNTSLLFLCQSEIHIRYYSVDGKKYYECGFHTYSWINAIVTVFNLLAFMFAEQTSISAAFSTLSLSNKCQNYGYLPDLLI